MKKPPPDKDLESPSSTRLEALVPSRVPANTGDPGLTWGQEDPLEKEMAIHSSTLAWKIPWTEEPARLQSMGSLRVGHD